MDEIGGCPGLFTSDLIVFTDFNIKSRSDMRERAETFNIETWIVEKSRFMEIYFRWDWIFLNASNESFFKALFVPVNISVFYHIPVLKTGKILAITFYLCEDSARKIKFQIPRFVGFRSCGKASTFREYRVTLLIDSKANKIGQRQPQRLDGLKTM